MAAFFGCATLALAQQTVPESVARVVEYRQPLRHLANETKLTLALGLPLRHRAELTNFLRDLYDPASPQFRQYLTAPEFAARFGPAAQDYEKVAQFARSHGLTVTARHSNRTLLDVNGTVAQVEKAFHLRLNVYRHPTEARNFFAPDRAPTIDLAVPLLGIRGLDDYISPKPMDLKTNAFFTDTNALPEVTGSGPSGYFIGGDFRAAYAPGVALNGAGQALGLFELDGYFPNDITDYEALARLPTVPLTNILLDGFSGAAGGDNIEVALDIEMAICMAPGLSRVIVYEGTVPDDVLNRMATDNQAKQLSSSWGFGPVTDAVREQIYLQFAAQGQSMFQASGDSGAYAGAIYPPSDDPNLTIVGGTTLVTSGPGGPWLEEDTWSGSGGGVSTVFPIPPWQQGVGMATNHGSTTMRNIPDVACLADILIWLIADNGMQGPIGGSSASTPLWAGFAALVNQQAAAAGRPALGFANPAIYALGLGNSYDSDFHDIVTGNTTNSSSPTNYFAVPGYDLCTGWGSPTGSALINALAAEPLQITPAGGLLFLDSTNGGFMPPAQSFTLTNIARGTLSWNAGSSNSAITLSPNNGVLTAGGSSTTVTVNVTAASNAMTAGIYTNVVAFTSQNDGIVQTRTITLAYSNAPILLTQPSSQSLPSGATAIFTVTAAANPALSFQWQENGSNLVNGGNISGATSSTLTISNISAANAGTYSVLVSNASGVAHSSGAVLNIISAPPVIVVQPVNQTVMQGQAVVFSVQASGTPPLFYQWTDNGMPLQDGGSVSGSSSSLLTISPVTAAQAGVYAVTITNGLGSVTSSNATLVVSLLTAPGVTLSTLNQFTGGGDGGGPNGLIQASNGLFYGTTQYGGTNGGGTIFEMNASGALATLYSFNYPSGGNTPSAALLQAADGNLYGTAEYGGTGQSGILFRSTLQGAVTNLANFNLGEGAGPLPALIQGQDGNLYGTTVAGGAANRGVVFSATTNGSVTTLASFSSAIGLNPNGLCQTSNGLFYGTTFDGGANGNGTIFQISSNGGLASLVSFNYSNGGYLPYGGLTLTAEGILYGTTYEGGTYGEGTIFIFSPPSNVSTIYNFTGGTDGSHPGAALTAGGDGNLYGTTAYGGVNDEGVVFRLSPTGANTTLAQFDGFDGGNPFAPVTLGGDGNLYGTTENGGVDDGGVIFKLSLNYPGVQITSQPVNQNAFVGSTVLFSVAVIGNGPLAYQWKENGTNLTDNATVNGSATRILIVSNITLASAGVYSVSISNAADSVVSSGAALGVSVSPPQIVTQPASQTATVGGAVTFSVGAIGDLPFSYQWELNGRPLANGGQVSGATTGTLILTNLLETNDGVYSVVISNAVGSSTSAGAVLTVLAVSESGTALASLYSFTGGSDGGVPNGLAVGGNGLLYGTTQSGGASGDGTIFSISTNGNFALVTMFNSSNGAAPFSALTLASNGTFYGTTRSGGSNGLGTLFGLSSNGILTSIYSFASNSLGLSPTNMLLAQANGILYGSSLISSNTGEGLIFTLNPSNSVFTLLHSFTGGSDGTFPVGGLTAGNDGNFYGMTPGGSTNGHGNIFRLTPSGSVNTLYSFTGGADGYIPSGALTLGTDGNFYGVTRRNVLGGFSFYGTVFKMTPSGAFTTLFSFNDGVTPAQGAYPFAGLLQASDGNFYGTTYTGVYSVNGTLFAVTPAGVESTISVFNGTDDGARPEAALVQGPDGALYGTTTSGGLNGQGTIFRLGFTGAPQILTQPISQTNVLDGTTLLSVTVLGAPPLTYQWLDNGVPLTDGNGITGSTSRVLALSDLTAASAGIYSVNVNNALGSTASGGAILTIEAAPSFLSASQNNGVISLTWSTMAGRIYQLQYNTNLAGGTWTNFGGTNTATGSILTASDNITLGAARFYRVLLLP